MTDRPKSLLIDVDGPVHVVDFGGPRDAPVVLCVHGLGSSSAGWSAFAEALRPSYRVLAVDLPGHGRSPAQGRSVSVPDAAAVLSRVIGQLGVAPPILVGHSMGAVVAVLAAASTPAAIDPPVIDRVMLLAPPLPRRGLAMVSKAVLPQVALCLWPRLGLAALQRRRARQSVEESVWQGLRLTCAKADGLQDVAEALAADLQAAHDGGDDPLEVFVTAARSVGRLVVEKQRYGAALTDVQIPVLVVHGALDRVLKPTSLQQLDMLGPRWQTRVMPDVGHSPHLEAPVAVARLLQEFAHAAGGSGESCSEGTRTEVGTASLPA